MLEWLVYIGLAAIVLYAVVVLVLHHYFPNDTP
jgi:hypothetical protein